MDHMSNNKFTNSHNNCWNVENMAMEAPNNIDDHPHTTTIQQHESIIPMWPPNFLPLHPSSSSSSSMPPPLAPNWSLLSSISTHPSTTQSQGYLLNQDQLMNMLSSSNNNNTSQIIFEEGGGGHNNNNNSKDDDDDDDKEEDEDEELGAMKEMMYRIAAMQPVDIDPASIRKPKRRNVRISDDPQSVAARHRRERISEKIRILQRLVPGGTKMDTASMLEEAIRYVKFLKRQIRQLQQAPNPSPININGPSSSPIMLGFGPHNLSLFNHHQVIKDN